MIVNNSRVHLLERYHSAFLTDCKDCCANTNVVLTYLLIYLFTYR